MLYVQLKDQVLLEAALANSTPWGEDSPQPIWRCLDHLMCIAVRTIEANTAGKDDLFLTDKEVQTWWSECNSSRPTK